MIISQILLMHVYKRNSQFRRKVNPIKMTQKYQGHKCLTTAEQAANHIDGFSKSYWKKIIENTVNPTLIGRKRLTLIFNS